MKFTSSSEQVRLMPHKLENNIGPTAHNGKMRDEIFLFVIVNGVYTNGAGA